MSLTLYFAPGACSFVPHCLLEASGAAYEPHMVKLHKGEQYDEAYKSINPRSQVPVLKDGEDVITQIVAICLYLDKKFQEHQFLPTDALARAKAAEAFVWMNNTVHPTFTHVFMPNKFSSDADVQANIKAHAIQSYRGLMGELQSLVKKKRPMVGRIALWPARCLCVDPHPLGHHCRHQPRRLSRLVVLCATRGTAPTGGPRDRARALAAEFVQSLNLRV